MKLQFYKEQLGNWYFFYPEWEGDISDLQMVAGADKMLDNISHGFPQVSLECSLQPMEASLILSLVQEPDDWGDGADYKVEGKWEGQIWLCYVTACLFKHYPKKIYLK